MKQNPYVEYVEIGDKQKNTVFDGTPEDAAEWIARNPENLIGVRREWSNDKEDLVSVDEFMLEWDRENGIR